MWGWAASDTRKCVCASLNIWSTVNELIDGVSPEPFIGKIPCHLFHCKLSHSGSKACVRKVICNGPQEGKTVRKHFCQGSIAFHSVQKQEPFFQSHPKRSVLFVWMTHDLYKSLFIYCSASQPFSYYDTLHNHKYFSRHTLKKHFSINVIDFFYFILEVQLNKIFQIWLHNNE